MNNINKNIISLYNSIPEEVIFNNILTYSNMQGYNIREIVSCARITKVYYTEFIKNVKGLCERTVEFSDHELLNNPLLPLFRLIDGLQRRYSMIALFEKYKWLLTKDYMPFGGDSSYIAEIFGEYRSLTMKAYNEGLFIRRSADSDEWETLEGRLNSDLDLKHEIFRSKGLIVLYFLAGVFDSNPIIQTLLPMLPILDGRNSYICIAFTCFLFIIYPFEPVREFLFNNVWTGSSNREILRTSRDVGFYLGLGLISLGGILALYYNIF